MEMQSKNINSHEMCRHLQQNPHKMCRRSKKTLIKRDGAFFLRYNTDNKGRNEMLLSGGILCI